MATQPTRNDLEQRISFLEQELHDKNEKLKLLTSNFENELKLAREKTQEKERNIHRITSTFETFFNTIDDFLFVLDEQGNIIHCNSTVEKRLGYTVEELKGQSILNVHPEDRRSETAKVATEVIAEKLASFQIPLVTKQGKQIYVETSAKHGTWNGKPAIFGVSKDITKLKLSEEKFSSVFYLNPSASGLTEANTGSFIEVNDAFCKLFDYTKEETIGHTAVELQIMTQKTKDKILSKADSLGRIYNVETEFKTKNGDLKSVLISSQNINIQDVTYRYTVVHDVTEIQKAKERAEENEQKFSMLLNACPEPLSVTSLEDGRFIVTNEALHKAFGFEKEEVINHTSIELNAWLSVEDRQRWANELNKYGSVRGVEFQLRTKQNGIRDFLISSDIIELDKKKCTINFYVDITDRKNIEIELLAAKEKAEESESKFKNLFLNMINAFALHEMIFNDNGKPIDYVFLEVNPIWEQHVGLKAETVIGKSIKQIMPNIEQSWIDRYGRIVLTGTPDEFIDYNEATQKYYNVFAYKHEGNKFAVFFNDITDKKQAEIELIKAKEKAEESDRLKTAFLQNMSHEIRTPLNAICGFSGFLSSEDLSADKRKNFVQIIQDSSDQLLSVVSDILMISSLETKQEKINISNVCINSILIELLAIFEQQAKDRNTSLSSEAELADSISEIYTDKTKVTQIISNLLSNSLKFTHAGSIEFGYHLIHNEIEFFVKDTGIGIKPELHEAIFDRFRQADNTIQRNYGGTGLGLSICKGLVELLGGRIRVQSQIGKGSTFYFTIPYKPVNEIEKVPILTRQPVNSGTILVAEDDEYNFKFLEEALSYLHSNIIRANNGKEAVEIFKSNPQIDLILMDIKMPVMNGYDAAEIIKSIKPDMPVIALSAYAMEYERAKYESMFDGYLTKPLKEELLTDVISKYFNTR